MERFEPAAIPLHPSVRRPRRWSPARLRSAVALSLAVLAVLASIVMGVPRRLAGWVERRPVYAWSADRITLSPPAPPWIRGGEAALLRSVRRTLDSFDGESALRLDPAAITRAFKNVAWIERVERVELSYPARASVHVRYRRPLVAIGPRRADGSRSRFLDVNAVLLPPEDIDEEAVPDLLGVNGLGHPADANPGASWSSDPAATEPDPRALAVTSLAAFLAEQVEAGGWPIDREGRPWKLVLIHLGAGPNPQVSLQAGDGTWIRWEPGGGARPDRPPPPERWRMLTEWAGKNRPGPVSSDQILDFGRHGVGWLQGAQQTARRSIERDNGR